MKKFEAWQNETEIAFGPVEKIASEKRQGLISDTATLIHTVYADTWEAMAVHHIKMGWEPYKPVGNAEFCPKCGSIYYPNGSGVCPKCG